jgi:2-phospho-L-lactate guanylyltransferase (CobY/MobA/RfbA family)
MTTVTVLCDAPNEDVLADLVATTPLAKSEIADLYAAMCADVFRAVETSASELLVNYRPSESGDAEAQLRALADAALDQPDAVRYEKQVGSSFAGRVGNTITHLLDTEEESSVMAIEPTAPFLARGDIDGLAMKLRRSDVVLGPASQGRVYAAGFSSTVDFAEAYTPPAIETLTDRATDAGLAVDYGPMVPVVESREDLMGAVALIRARRRAGRDVPKHTAECFDELGLALVEEDGDLVLGKADTDRS